MISYHHSFSSRIFVQAAPGTAAATSETRAADEIREFWWFLRAGRDEAAIQPRAGGVPARPRPDAHPVHPPARRHA